MGTQGQVEQRVHPAPQVQAAYRVPAELLVLQEPPEVVVVKVCRELVVTPDHPAQRVHQEPQVVAVVRDSPE